jgi:hypothetical protein
LSRFANRHHADYGADTDGDAQDRKGASHLISNQGQKRRSNCGFVIHDVV